MSRHFRYSLLSVPSFIWLLFCLLLAIMKARSFRGLIVPPTHRHGNSFLSLYASPSKTLHQSMTEPSLFGKSGGILYKQSIFSKEEYSTVSEEIASHTNKLKKETSSSIAQNRLGTSLPLNTKVVQILQQGSLSRLVQQVAGSDYQLANQLPVEIRVYEQAGACMAWHVDDVLFDPPQIEVIWTLENTSDCQTRWKLPDGTIQSVETDPNSVILLRAGGPLHCVTSLKRGRRVIVKCAYVSKDAIFREGIHTNQFESSKRGTKKKRKRNR